MTSRHIGKYNIVMKKLFYGIVALFIMFLFVLVVNNLFFDGADFYRAGLNSLYIFSIVGLVWGVVEIFKNY